MVGNVKSNVQEFIDEAEIEKWLREESNEISELKEGDIFEIKFFSIF
jgi:hypothetical protein